MWRQKLIKALGTLQLQHNLKKTRNRQIQGSSPNPFPAKRYPMMTFTYITHFIDMKDYMFCVPLIFLSNTNSAFLSLKSFLSPVNTDGLYLLLAETKYSAFALDPITQRRCFHRSPPSTTSSVFPLLCLFPITYNRAIVSSSA